MNELRKLLFLLILGICLTPMLSSCGGGGGESESTPPVPTAQPHDPATMLLNESNVRFSMANAQAVQHVFRRWIDSARWAAGSVDPVNTTNSFLCGGGGQLDMTYSDMDGNKKISKGDKILAEGSVCGVIALGRGRTEYTIMRTNLSKIADARVRAEGMLDDSSLGIYGWSQKMSGTMRFLFLDPLTTLVLSEGEIELTLRTGQILKLRNVAITYNAQSETTTGQFDIFFSTGREAGTSVQVDTLGKLQSWGSNVGPAPGALQLSGLDGTKAKLEGLYIAGPIFRMLADFSGNGQLLEIDSVSDSVFYSWLLQ